MSVLVSLTDPAAVRIDCDGGTWFTIGLNIAQRAALASAGPDPSAAERVLRNQRDANAILIETPADGAGVLTAWRTVVSGADIFFAHRPDGSLIVSDHFRNAVAAVPVADRAPVEAELVEHYVTGWIRDGRTYARGVRRLIRGQRLTYDLGSRTLSVSRFDRLETMSEPGAEADAVDRVERALDELISGLPTDGSAGLGFSGGVDSTLLASFLPEDIPLLTIVPDSPEFAGETEYARAAASKLGRELTPMAFREADYLDMLEETIDRLATPPIHYVTPAFLAVYRQPQQTIVLGEGADSIFGSGRGMERVSGMFGSPAGLATLSMLGRFPGFLGRRAKQVRGYASLFAADPDAAGGYGGRCLLFGDTSIVEAMVGRRPIDELAEGYAALVHDVAEVETPRNRNFLRHIEMHGLRFTIADLAYLDRHLAHSYGKTAVQPFTVWPLVEEALRIPAAKRYIKGLQGKWVLKEVLERRVPSYPTRQRKFATGLPFERYYTDGPLTGVWEKYTMPDFVEPGFHDAVMGKPGAVTFNAITHSIWSERIEKNPDLEPLPTSLCYEKADGGAQKPICRA